MNTPLTSALLDERMMRIETAFNSAIIPENMAEQSRTMQTQITAWKELISQTQPPMNSPNFEENSMVSERTEYK